MLQIKTQSSNLLMALFLLSLSLAIFTVDSIAETSANLLQNPGAETGSLSPWTICDCDSDGSANCFEVTEKDGDVTPKSGSYFFAGYKDNAGGSAAQTIDLSTYTDKNAKVRFSGYLRALGTDSKDFARLEMTFLKSDGLVSDTPTKKSKDVKSDSWTSTSISASIPSDAAKVEVKMHADQGGSGGGVDAYFDDLKLVVEWAQAGGGSSVDALDFGDLYVYAKDYDNGAEAYNKEQTKQIPIQNTGEEGSKLNWEITDDTPDDGVLTLPDGVKVSLVSPLSGSLDSGAKATITVWLMPTSEGSFSGTLNVLVGDETNSITLSAVVHSTPRVTFENLTHPNNNSINIGPNEKTTLNVKSANPSFPGAGIGKYQWQYAEGDLAPDLKRWSTTSADAPEKEFIFPQAMNYTIYCRMVDSNGVAGDYEGISVRVWNKPEITGGAGSSWYNMDSYFFGVVNQPLFLKAEVDENGNESIAKTVWTMDDEEIGIAPGSPGMVCDIYQVPPNALSSYSLNNYERYVKDEGVKVIEEKKDSLRTLTFLDVPFGSHVLRPCVAYDGQRVIAAIDEPTLNRLLATRRGGPNLSDDAYFQKLTEGMPRMGTALSFMRSGSPSGFGDVVRSLDDSESSATWKLMDVLESLSDIEGDMASVTVYRDDGILKVTSQPLKGVDHALRAGAGLSQSVGARSLIAPGIAAIAIPGVVKAQTNDWRVDIDMQAMADTIRTLVIRLADSLPSDETDD